MKGALEVLLVRWVSFLAFVVGVPVQIASAQSQPGQFTYCVVMFVDGFRYSIGCDQVQPNQVIEPGRPGVPPELLLQQYRRQYGPRFTDSGYGNQYYGDPGYDRGRYEDYYDRYYGDQYRAPDYFNEPRSCPTPDGSGSCGSMPNYDQYAPPEPQPPQQWSLPPSAGIPGVAPRGGLCAQPEVQAVIANANYARQSQGLGPVVCDEALSRAALMHSQDMCSRRFFNHISPEGQSPMDRAELAGVTNAAIGENIAMGQRDANEVHQGWMESQGHRENILNSTYRRLGVGYEMCGGTPYWTQLFGD